MVPSFIETGQGKHSFENSVRETLLLFPEMETTKICAADTARVKTTNQVKPGCVGVNESCKTSDMFGGSQARGSKC